MNMFRLKEIVRLLPSKNKKTDKYIGLEDIESWSGKFKPQIINENIQPETWRLIEKNSINFGKLRPYLAKVFLSDNEYIGTTELISFKPNKKMNSKFLLYYLLNKQFIHLVNENCSGVKMPRLNWEILGTQLIYVPPLNQQIKIANYLDTETSRIDRKISILEQKYEKLEEYKQSVIFETVTKGLDKNVELKDSGIDWIGDIPKHWEVKRVKEFYKLGMGQTILKEDLIEDGKYPVYSATAEDKFFGYVNKINNPLNIGDLVIPARGNSIGHVKLVKETVACTQTTIYMKQKSKIDSSFVYYYLLGNKSQLFFFDDTAIPQITVEQINGRLILVPSSHEQKEIVIFLNNLCSKIDKKVEIIKKQIELLKEYKQTIIYEAVTGKMEIL